MEMSNAVYIGHALARFSGKEIDTRERSSMRMSSGWEAGTPRGHNEPRRGSS